MSDIDFDMNRPWLATLVEDTLKYSKQLPEIQNEAEDWLHHNFPNTTPEEQFMGVVEEVGELSHAMLKRAQGIRSGSKVTEEDMRDAVGDIMIFLINYCSTMEWDALEILQETWAQVQKRDWQKNPDTGVDIENP